MFQTLLIHDFHPILSSSLSQEFNTGSPVFINPIHCIDNLDNHLGTEVWATGCGFRLPTLPLIGYVRFWVAHHSSEQQWPAIVTGMGIIMVVLFYDDSLKIIVEKIK